MDGGAGDSVRPSAGRADEAPLDVALGIGICLKLGDVIAGDLADGLVGATAGD